MSAIEFTERYTELLESFEPFVNESLYPALNYFYRQDPQCLIEPRTWFPDEAAAKGFLWQLLTEFAKCQPIA